MSEKKINLEESYNELSELPADAYIEPQSQSDEDLLDALLGTPDESTKDVYMKRFKKYFTVKAISSEEYSKLENRCKYPVKNTRTHRLEEKIDQDKLANLLILTACVKPDWSNKKLLEKYGTSEPTTVIKKRLFIGEINELSNAIMEISGFDDGLEEIKNSFNEAKKQE